jgi:hypothetical protein
VLETEREARAGEIAAQLCDHSRWLSHGRSIKMTDLNAMRLKVTDYSDQPDLFDAIRRYHTLLQMTFDSAIYKIFETPTSQIYRMNAQATPTAALPVSAGNKAIAQIECGQCHTSLKIQLNFGRGIPLEPGCIAYPPSDVLKCPTCGFEHNLSTMRQQLEMQLKREVVRDA